MSSANKPVVLAQPTPRGGQDPMRSGNSSSAPLSLLVILGILIPLALVYGFATYNDLQVIGVIIAFLAVLFILAKPYWGLIFFFGLLYVRPEESIPVLNGMHFTLVVALVTLFGMSCKMLMDREHIVRTPLNWMIFGFGIAGVLSSMSAGDDPTNTIQDLGRLIILVFLVVNLVRTPDKFQSTITALLILTGYLAAYSIYLNYSGQVVYEDGVTRSKATGIFSDPNDLAATFIAGLALLVPRLLRAPRLSQILHGCLTVLLLWGIYLTNSRGGTFAMVVMFASYVVAAKIPWKAKAGIAIAGIILYISIAGGRSTNFDSTDQSANQRFWYWKSGFDMLYAHPFTGVGYNHFEANNGGMTAHNSFVLCFAELGLLGYYFWMGCLYCAFRSNPAAAATIESSFSNSLDPLYEQNLMSARIGLITYLAASFWLSHTYSPILYIYICLPIAAQCSRMTWSESAAHPEAKPEPGKRRVPRIPDWSKIAVACGLSLVIIESMIRRYA